MSTASRAARVAALHDRATTYAEERPFIARLWRTVARYVEVRVSRLAAFLTYYGFLAVFPLAALGFAILGVLSRYIPQLDAAVEGSLTGQAGTLGLSPQILDQLQRAAVGLGLISLCFLLYAGVRFIGALREALALVNGGEVPRGAIVRRVLADLGLLALLGLVFLGSVVLSTITSTSATWLTELLHLGQADALVRLGAAAVSLLATTVVLMLVLTRLARDTVQRRHLLQGALVGALGLDVLRQGTTYLIGRSLSNPIYGVFAITIGLLIWINLTAKWVLIVATWVAVADDPGLGESFLPGAASGVHEPSPAAGLASSVAERDSPDREPRSNEQDAHER